MITLIRNARVFAPDDLGVCDILIAGERILRIAKHIEGLDESPDVELINANGLYASPGFIDLHTHITGGGGEGGFQNRTPEATLTDFTKAGVTTVLGLLGTDGVTRSIENLLAKTNALRHDGLSCYMLTGAYGCPSPTLTGSVERDIVLLNPVIGAKLALSDHRGSEPSFDEFLRIACDVRRGGLLSGKAGLLTIHMGDGRAMLSYLFRAAKQSDIPLKTFLPTHVARNDDLYSEAVRWIKAGGFADFSAGEDGGTAKKLAKAVEMGAEPSHITMSSDAFGSLPKFDEQGRCIGLTWDTSAILQDEFKRLVKDCGMSMDMALSFFTENAASRLGLAGLKGVIAEGADADLLLLDDELNIELVMARGRTMLRSGKPTAFDAFGR